MRTLLLANRLLFISTLFWLICRQSDPQLWLVWMTLNSVEVSGKSDTTLCCIVTLEGIPRRGWNLRRATKSVQSRLTGCVFTCGPNPLCEEMILDTYYFPFTQTFRFVSIFIHFKIKLCSVTVNWVTECLICLAHNLTIIKNMSLLCYDQWYHSIHQL